VKDLSEPERLLGEAFPLGAWVDLRAGRPGIDDPKTGSRWPASRLIRAEVIRGIVLGQQGAGHGEVAAVRLAGARISGLLDLIHAEVPFPVYLHGCWLEKAPDLRWSNIRHLDLSDSHFPAINAESAHIERDLVMAGCVARAVTLRRARVGGDLTMRGARLSGESGLSIDATACSVTGDMNMEDIAAEGTVRLTDAAVSGALDLKGGTAQQSRRHGAGRYPDHCRRHRVLPRRIHQPRRCRPPHGSHHRGRVLLPGTHQRVPGHGRCADRE
jgi:hypothetical protein